MKVKSERNLDNSILELGTLLVLEFVTIDASVWCDQKRGKWDRECGRVGKGHGKFYLRLDSIRVIIFMNFCNSIDYIIDFKIAKPLKLAVWAPWQNTYQYIIIKIIDYRDKISYLLLTTHSRFHVFVQNLKL